MPLAVALWGIRACSVSLPLPPNARPTARPTLCLQVLAQLPQLEVADLSFNIYMEAAASLAPLTADGGLAALRRLDLRCGWSAVYCEHTGKGRA